MSGIFSSLDTNQDGTISADELMALFDDLESESGDTASASSTSQTDSSTSKLGETVLKQILASYDGYSGTNTNSQLNLSA